MKIVLPGGGIAIAGDSVYNRLFAVTAERMGYRVVDDPDAADVVANLDAPALDIAKPMPVERPLAEFSVTGARGSDGRCVLYAPASIDRTGGAVDVVRAPAAIGPRLARQAANAAEAILREHGIVGVICVEFTVTQTQELLMREATPHPGASGLFTSDACVTGQFEQYLRAICGLPLGSAELVRPCATAVLNGNVDWSAACGFPEVKIYPCGAGGHLSATAASATAAKQIVLAARAACRRRPSRNVP